MKNIHIQNLIDDGLIKNGRALDLGSGVGDAAQFLASKGFEVEAVDVKDQTIPHVAFIKSDILAYRIPEATYDFIHARNVLPFIKKEETKNFIKKMHAGLKPGGVLFFTLFGDKDEWNGVKKNMTFLSEAEVADVTEILTPLFSKTIKLGQGKAMDGSWKFWHVYTFIYVKK